MSALIVCIAVIAFISCSARRLVLMVAAMVDIGCYGEFKFLWRWHLIVCRYGEVDGWDGLFVYGGGYG